MNGAETGKVVLGPSCSALCKMLADCYGDVLTPGDEVIVAEAGHEANVGPWMKLEKFGIKVRMWKMDPQTFITPLSDLEDLLNQRTRIVAFPHVSNLLGDIVDIHAITDLAHRFEARVVVDGVAYAPHRAMDVQSWDVDWYVYSAYKVYGPHMAALYGKADAFQTLTGPNHYFIPKEEVPYKFELGGVCHEGCSGLLGLGEYIRFLAGYEGPGSPDRGTIDKAYDLMTRCEAPLIERLVTYLKTKPEVRIVGPSTTDTSRVGTISFLDDRLTSKEIADAANKRNFGIRNGHMYAHRLCKAIGIDPEDGVVRVSLVHYNTPEEIEQLIQVFEEVL
jgi:selenocysteine lyase/cysteine desulfurase